MGVPLPKLPFSSFHERDTLEPVKNFFPETVNDAPETVSYAPETVSYVPETVSYIPETGWRKSKRDKKTRGLGDTGGRW